MSDVLTEDLSDVTTADMVASVKRELAMRERVYPNWVASGRMKHEGAQVEMRRMRAVLKVLLERQAAETPCTHVHWKFEDHGRRCSCGTLMLDPGD